MKTILILLIVAISICLNINSCTRTPSIRQVPFNALLTNPEKYNGNIITTEGIYIQGWEWSLLVESVTFTGSGQFRTLQGVGQSIWVTGEIPEEIYDRLYQNTSSGAGTQYYGKIKVTGRFDFGGQYGHLGASKYQITASKVELLEWTPPE